MSYVQP